MTRLRLAALLLIVASVLDAAPRRRAVGHPGMPDESPETWLRLNAFPLQTAEVSPLRSDLAPLRTIVGDADVVALGEATHGTHEFYTVRIRMIDYLVREMGFDVVAMEAPFPILNRVNAYVQGAPDSPRSILSAAYALGYYFWDVQELIDLMEWARTYNAERGARPILEFAGFDTYDHRSAATAVIEYLRTADAAAAADAERAYECVFGTGSGSSCSSEAAAVRHALSLRESELAPKTSARAFHDALQNATVVQQYLQDGAYGARRDEYLAANALWIREHRGASRRIIVWAHQAHAEKTPIEWIGGHDSMGQHLDRALGDDYVMIGTATRTGSFLQWNTPRGGVTTAGTYAFPTTTSSGYESFFTRGGAAILLIPLRGALPAWLREPNTLQSAPANPSPIYTLFGSLPEMMDAVVYFETTTPARR